MNASQPPITPAAMDRLLDESRWLSDLARRLVRDPGLADDLAQDTLVAALGAARQPEPERRRGWLATILRRKLISRHRDEARREHREYVSAQSEALPSAHELSALLESEQLLRDALAELKEPYRRALTLRYREGISAAEIARRDGEPAGTVRSRIRNGLQMLRKQLEQRDRHWAAALLPLANVPGAPQAMTAKVAGTTTGSVSAYVVAAAILSAVCIPVGWKLTRPAEDLPAPTVVAAVEKNLDEGATITPEER